MCGIAGIVVRRPIEPSLLRARVSSMCNTQTHRGPDAEGVFVSQRAPVAIGSRRLAIMDVSSAGHQPMSDNRQRLWITYNGEIYNFDELRCELAAQGCSFTSQTDTEVVLRLYDRYGENCVSRLRGMFAFAIWDEDRQRLLLARDRLGIKPLYVTETADAVVFASEVRGILASGFVAKDLDFEACAGFLMFGSVPSPLTTVRGVRVFPAAHSMTIDVVGHSARLGTPRSYWTLPPEIPSKRANPAALAPHRSIYNELDEAVRRHLIADVPVGVFLSGGLDSTVVVALASHHTRRLVTVTAAFEEGEFDESHHARAVSAHFDTDHREILFRHSDFVGSVDGFLAALDQPTDDGLNTYLISRAARQAGLKVALSGVGSDELFGGYPHYVRLAKSPGAGIGLLSWKSWPRAPMARSVAAVARRWHDGWGRLAYLAEPSGRAVYSLARGLFSPKRIADLLGASETELQNVFGLIQTGDGSLLTQVSRLEFERYLHDQLLRDTDAMSMANSLEVRVPYLDDRVVESVIGLPPWQKVSKRINKPLLVDAMGPELPAAIATRRKMGFTLPFDPWIRKSLTQFYDLSLGGIANRAAVEDVWSRFRSGTIHWSRVWALVVLGNATRN